jgi:Na+-driven multidrug efflux pump
MPLLSPLFTHDAAVMAAVNSTTPYLASMFALSGIVCSGEGLLLGQKDLKFLSNSFGLFFFVVPYLLFQVKKAILNGAQGIGLFSVWRIFSFYQMFRCMLWLFRLKQLAIKDESRL